MSLSLAVWPAVSYSSDLEAPDFESTAVEEILGTSASLENPDVALPGKSGDPIVLDSPVSSDSISITPELAGETAAINIDGTSFLSDDAQSVVVQSLPTGVRVMSIIENSDSPSSMTYNVDLPEGATLQIDPLDGISVIRDGEAIGRFAAPWAVDANQVELPTAYSVEGNTITQSVDVRGASFPVVADPHYTWGIVTGTVYFNKSETQKIAASTAFLAGIGAFAPPPFNVLFVVSAGGMSLIAAWALADGKCVSLKSNGDIGSYGGKQGDGYCR